MSCKISEDLDFDFLAMKNYVFFHHSSFNHDVKKRHVMFFKTWLLKESDGLVDSDCDSDVIDVWGKS